MIPTNTIFLSNESTSFDYENQPTLSHKLNFENGRVGGYVDKLEAYKQRIYLLLNTERYKHIIFSWDYGIELEDLFGQPIAYVVPEIERRLTEAVMTDRESEKVSDFEFDTSKKGIVYVKFKATSVYGEVEFEKNVEI